MSTRQRERQERKKKKKKTAMSSSPVQVPLTAAIEVVAGESSGAAGVDAAPITATQEDVEAATVERLLLEAAPQHAASTPPPIAPAQSGSSPDDARSHSSALEPASRLLEILIQVLTRRLILAPVLKPRLPQLSQIRDKPGTMAELDSFIAEITSAPGMPQRLSELIQSMPR